MWSQPVNESPVYFPVDLLEGCVFPFESLYYIFAELWCCASVPDFVGIVVDNGYFASVGFDADELYWVMWETKN